VIATSPQLLEPKHRHIFQKAFACFECSRKGSEELTIDSRAAWMDHGARIYKCNGQTGAEVDSEWERIPRKRKRGDCTDMTSRKYVRLG
jgi:hypothetical protein